MKKINILFLVSRFDIGGVQKLNVSMVNLIDKEKFNIHIIYIKEGVFKQEITDSKVTFFKIGNILKLNLL